MAVTTANNHAAVTPSDATVFDEVNAIFVGVGGDVALVLEGSSTTATYKNVPSGTFLPVNARKVLSTGTTATNILRLFN